MWDSVKCAWPYCAESTAIMLYGLLCTYFLFCNKEMVIQTAPQAYLCCSVFCRCWSAWVFSGGICHCSGSGPVQLSWVECCRPHTTWRSAASSPFWVCIVKSAECPPVTAAPVLHLDPGFRSKARCPFGRLLCRRHSGLAQYLAELTDWKDVSYLPQMKRTRWRRPWI